MDSYGSLVFIKKISLVDENAQCTVELILSKVKVFLEVDEIASVQGTGY